MFLEDLYKDYNDHEIKQLLHELLHEAERRGLINKNKVKKQKRDMKKAEKKKKPMVSNIRFNKWLNFQ